jgi:hypothetical protein
MKRAPKHSVAVLIVRAIMLILVGVATSVLTASPVFASGPSGVISFTVDSATWTPAEKAELNKLLEPGSTFMKTELGVTGPPAENLSISVIKKANSDEYGNHEIRLSSLRMSVLAHEIDHAVHDRWILTNSVWEEGEARAVEYEVMRLMAQKGVTEEGFKYNHTYPYSEYYDQNNVSTVGVPNGNIFAEQALTLLRYEQSGVAFTKLGIENPHFEAQFNAKKFTHPNGFLSLSQLVAIAKEVQPTIEGEAFAKWRVKQHIFDISQPAGCYNFQRANQYTVDVYCTEASGNVVAQTGVNVSLKIVGSSKATLFQEEKATTEQGWTAFEPLLKASVGRIKMLATAGSSGGTVKSTFYRQSGSAEGVFGVVTNATTGSVTFSSPATQFGTFSVAVANGAFVAPSLETIRGQVVANFSGEGKSAQRTFNKDGGPTSLVITAK